MTLIPNSFFDEIPYAELKRICRNLAIGVVNEDSKIADAALIQLMMEVDVAGKIVNLKKEGKHEEAKELREKLKDSPTQNTSRSNIITARKGSSIILKP